MSNYQGAIFDSARPHGGRRLAAAVQFCGRIGSWMRGALPQLCALCAAPSGSQLVCAPCARALPHIGVACPHCALATPEGVACMACRSRPPPWRHAHAAFAYAYPLDRLLHALKYRGALAYAPLLAHALADRIERAGAAALPEAIVALPLAVARQRERGYNQAIEIARPLARRLRVPLVAGLRRVRDTPALADLPWRERHRAVADAFVAQGPLVGRSIALVDDVLTTGATLRSATRALLAGGASSIDVWIVARTLPPSS